MKTPVSSFTLSYEGSMAARHEIEFYDVAQALIGFERSLALTIHLILNGEVITHAPKLIGAQLIAQPPEAGSWKFRTTVAFVSTALYQLGTAPPDTPIGNLIRSGYDYVISESLGFHVDYDKTLGQQYEELNKHARTGLPIIDQTKFDSVIEKCDTAIKIMHRPIVESESATRARVYSNIGSKEEPLGQPFTAKTYDYIRHTKKSDDTEEISGRIAGYYSNTYKGRIYIPKNRRSVPFELAENARDEASIIHVTSNLAINAKARFRKGEFRELKCRAFRITSRSGQLKGFLIVKVIGEQDV